MFRMEVKGMLQRSSKSNSPKKAALIKAKSETNLSALSAPGSLARGCSAPLPIRSEKEVPRSEPLPIGSKKTNVVYEPPMKYFWADRHKQAETPKGVPEETWEQIISHRR